MLKLAFRKVGLSCFEMDHRATDVTRFIPISSKDYRPNFVWKDMTIVWVE